MAEVAVKEEGEVARPLKVLVPLIEQDIENGEKAGVEYYRAAGEKLNEARDGHFEGRTAEFFGWAEKKFKKTRTTIRTWMSLGAQSPGKSFKSQRDFQRRETGVNPTPNRIHRDWTRPVDDVADRARAEQRRFQQEDALTRVQERQAEVKLGQRLIDIGYKVLAKELHPDKMGGSREAMTRLNRVRERLRSHV